MNVESLNTPQMGPFQDFERTRLQSLLHAPATQVTRRAVRERSSGLAARRLLFTSFFRQAQNESSAHFDFLRSASAETRPFAAPGQPMHQTPFAAFIAEFVASNRVASARALLAAISADQRVSGDL